MVRFYSELFKLFLLLGDLLLLNLSVMGASLFRYGNLLFLSGKEIQLVVLFFNLMWLLISGRLHLYRIHRSLKPVRTIEPLLRTLFFHLLSITFLLIAFNFREFPRLLLFYSYILFTILTSTWRIIFLQLLRYIRKRGLNLRYVVILGYGPAGKQLMQFFMSEISYGYKFLGFFDDLQSFEKNNGLLLGKIADAIRYSMNNRVDEIYWTLSDYDPVKVREILNFCEDHFIRFRIIPDINRYVSRNVSLEMFDSVPVVTLRREPLEGLTNRMIKRITDLLVSVFALLVIFPPVFLIAALLIRFDSPGPVFFRQVRWGKQNRRFITYKFRTMYCGCREEDQTGNYAQASRGDRRITRTGRFLRRSSLDEFPQFWNVLKGEMSVVGPRPHPEPLNERSLKEVTRYCLRHLVKPGITGLAQISGCRGETLDPEAMRRRVELDIRYLENWTIWLELSIILRTCIKMFRDDPNAF